MSEARIVWRIDHTAPGSYADQLVAAVRTAVGTAQCAAGDKLPTVRGLATELSLAPNTVAKAYRLLEASGVIETRGRAGSFIRGEGVEREARDAAHQYVRRLQALGVSRAKGEELVRSLWPQSAQ